MADLEVTYKTISITTENLPEQMLWEECGSCWIARREFDGTSWRWVPMNAMARLKAGPTGEMTDHYPILNKEIVAVKDDNTFRVSDVLLDTATNPQHMFALLLPGMLHAKQQGRKIILQEPYKTMWQDHLKKNNHYATP